MQRRRCAAMLDHRGCNDDAAHNDHILALITAAHAEPLPYPKCSRAASAFLTGSKFRRICLRPPTK